MRIRQWKLLLMKHWIIIQMLSVLTTSTATGKDIHVASTDVEATAVIKKNQKKESRLIIMPADFRRIWHHEKHVCSQTEKVCVQILKSFIGYVKIFLSSQKEIKGAGSRQFCKKNNPTLLITIGAAEGYFQLQEKRRMVKRETGANPVRIHHCDKGVPIRILVTDAD